MIFEAAHVLGALPLLWLLWLVRQGRPVDRRVWWLAGAFGVSFVADTLAHVVDPLAVSMVYPLSQVGLVAVVLTDRWEAALWLIGLAFAAILTALFQVDILEAVAGGTASLLAYRALPTGLREAVVVTFGLGALAWVGYLVWPGWNSWGMYQGVRLVGTVLFCDATFTPRRCLCLT